MPRPLVLPLSGLIAGIVIGNYLEIPYQLLLICLLLILALLFLSQRKHWRITCISLIFCFALISGILNIQRQQYLIPADQNIAQHVESGRKTVEGIIIESPSLYPDKKILIVRCLRILKDGIYIPVAGNIRLVIPVAMKFSYGDYVRFYSVLKKIHNFNNPGGFNYEQYLNRASLRRGLSPTRQV
jgi:competence protein ComEC